MTVKEILKKELSLEEINEWLEELLGFSCAIEDGGKTWERFVVFDEEGEYFDYKKIIRLELNTLSEILYMKEKIDEERGNWRGTNKVQNAIKTALGINTQN